MSENSIPTNVEDLENFVRQCRFVLRDAEHALARMKDPTATDEQKSLSLFSLKLNWLNNSSAITPFISLDSSYRRLNLGGTDLFPDGVNPNP